MYNSRKSYPTILSYPLSFYLLLFCCTNVFGQANLIGIGQWQSHLSYQTMVAITESEDAVFYASSQAILKVNKADQSLEHLNKVSGLSDMGIKTIDYNRSEHLLTVAYRNGNIDLLYDNGQVTNLSAILTNSNISGNKSINHIYNSGKEIYFSCAFGLVVYDLTINAFSQTTFTPYNVKACSRLDDTLFIATSGGIFKGEISSAVNLLDFGFWQLQGAAQGLVNGAYSSKNIILFQNKLYADARDTIFQYSAGKWSHISGFDKASNTAISYWKPTDGNTDFVVNYNLSLNYNKTSLIMATNTAKYYTMNANYDIYTSYHAGAWRLQDIVVDQNNITWAADEGYIHRDFKYVKPNAPYRELVSDMHVDKYGTLWVTSSPYDSYTAHFNPFGLFKYKEGTWSLINRTTQPKLDTFWDAIRVTSNPKNDRIYVGSFMNGLMEMDANGGIQLYDQYTAGSPLSGADGDESRTRVSGLAVDEDGILWMTNSRSYTSLLIAKKLNGTWKEFPSTKFNDYQVSDVVIDRNGYKWIKQVTGKITVFDSGLIDNDSDDRSIQLGDNNTVLPNNGISSIVSDKNGVIWVGTNAGICIFNCSSSIFETGCQGNQPVISQDNFNGHLLEGEEILDIAVDGANRKWVATKNGLFFLSEDGADQLAYFTENNSPLFGNEVTSLAVDGITGILYIATPSGIQSYRSDATTGLRKMPKENVTVFPHPVEPDYDGPIAISNLADEANVKITDISGRLVYETTALGGQAIWYGTDYNGRRAQTGVYLVFVVNEEGTQDAVCKILFMN